MARKEHNLTGLEIEEDGVSYELKPQRKKSKLFRLPTRLHFLVTSKLTVTAAFEPVKPCTSGREAWAD